MSKQYCVCVPNHQAAVVVAVCEVLLVCVLLVEYAAGYAAPLAAWMQLVFAAIALVVLCLGLWKQVSALLVSWALVSAVELLAGLITCFVLIVRAATIHGVTDDQRYAIVTDMVVNIFVYLLLFTTKIWSLLVICSVRRELDQASALGLS